MISAVPRALKRFMTEQASATGSREPAKDADVDFGGLAVGGEPLMRQWFEINGERSGALAE